MAAFQITFLLPLIRFQCSGISSEICSSFGFGEFNFCILNWPFCCPSMTFFFLFCAYGFLIDYCQAVIFWICSARSKLCKQELRAPEIKRSLHCVLFHHFLSVRYDCRWLIALLFF